VPAASRRGSRSACPAPRARILQTYDPTSPLADSKGMVAVPNIAVPGEVAKVLAARRQFEASANLLQVATRMQKSALDVLA
jgi:flagellar basal body rod protein FlgC